MTYLAYINERSYAIEDARLEGFKSSVLDAVHSGGGFVELASAGGRPVRVMVTHSSALRIEKLPAVDETPDDVDIYDFAYFELDG